MIFLLVLGGVLYLALMPNRNGRLRLPFISNTLHRWISEHDDFDNIVAFAVFSTVTFLVRRNPSVSEGARDSDAIFRRFANREVRLVGLLSLVCSFEILQKWIPGRVSSMQDVCTGWSGIFSAWLLTVLLDARVKNADAGTQPGTDAARSPGIGSGP